jgi:hypothetical protein
LKKLFIRNKSIKIRVSEEEYKEIERKSLLYNFGSISHYLRYVGLNTCVTRSSICNDKRRIGNENTINNKS